MEPLTCSECGKEYKTAKPLANHLWRAHGIGEPPAFAAPGDSGGGKDKEEKLKAVRAKVHAETKAKYEMFLGSVATALQMFPSTRADAMVIRDSMPGLSEAVGMAAENSARVVEVVDQMVGSLALLFLVVTHGGLIQAIIKNHTNPDMVAKRTEVENLKEQFRNAQQQTAPETPEPQFNIAGIPMDENGNLVV